MEGLAQRQLQAPTLESMLLRMEEMEVSPEHGPKERPPHKGHREFERAPLVSLSCKACVMFDSLGQAVLWGYSEYTVQSCPDLYYCLAEKCI